MFVKWDRERMILLILKKLCGGGEREKSGNAVGKEQAKQLFFGKEEETRFQHIPPAHE